MGFTSWIDARIKTAVDEAVTQENTAVRQDIADLVTKVEALPASLAGTIETALKNLLPNFLRASATYREPEAR